MFAEQLLNAKSRTASAAPNSPATLSLDAVEGQRWFVGGLAAQYDPPVAGVKNIVFSWGPDQKIYRWDFSRGPFFHNFPLLVHSDYGTGVLVILEADAGAAGEVSALAALV